MERRSFFCVLSRTSQSQQIQMGSEVDALLSKLISPDVYSGNRHSRGFYPSKMYALQPIAFLFLPQNLVYHILLRK